ncbi:MAG TPA: hypothetical protein VHC90_10160 [Bryobacteraceae bacterium]|nr:hypothetical protein [Bryobacteraceae bacterium]
MSSTSSINNLASNLSYLLENQALNPSNNNQSGNPLTGLQSVTGAPQSDSSELSPLGGVLKTLQQLQQSSPTEYAQVTSQIAANLQNAAQTASSDGNTAAASQLTQLSNDFQTASTSGQLPNVQDLAHAVGGGGHHHHHHAGGSSDADSSTSSTSNISGSSQTLSQLLAALQSNGSNQTDSLNPLNIIVNTLSGAGVTGSNS